MARVVDKLRAGQTKSMKNRSAGEPRRPAPSSCGDQICTAPAESISVINISTISASTGTSVMRYYYFSRSRSIRISLIRPRTWRSNYNGGLVLIIHPIIATCWPLFSWLISTSASATVAIPRSILFVSPDHQRRVYCLEKICCRPTSNYSLFLIVELAGQHCHCQPCFKIFLRWFYL